MKIAVYSPFSRNTGNTTVSLLLAMGLADKKRPVFLTHVDKESTSFSRYLGIEEYEDKTTTASQLVRLMQEGALSVPEIHDYTKHPVEFLDVFTNNKKDFTQIEMDNLLKYIIDSGTNYEYRVFDMDMDISTPSSRYVMSQCDIVVLVAPPDVVKLNKMKQMERELKLLFRGKSIIVVSSKHNESILKTKQIAKELGFKTIVFPLHYSKWIAWATNRGKLPYTYNQSKQKDADVLEIYTSVQSVVKAIGKSKLSLLKQRGKGDTEQ